MKEITLVIYPMDEGYGKRLFSFLVAKRNPLFQVEVVTEGSKLNDRLLSDENILITDRTDVEECEIPGRVIYLSKKRTKEANYVYQFQRANDLYEDLMQAIGVREDMQPLQEDNDGISVQSGVYSVFSPNPMLSSAYAAMLTQHLSMAGKCLYVCIGGFPIFSNDTIGMYDYAGKCFEQLIMRVQSDNFKNDLDELCIPFGDGFMLPPMYHYKDYLDCNIDEIDILFEKIIKESDFDSVVFDVSQLFEYSIDLLEKSELTYFIRPDGKIGKIYEETFFHYLELEKRDNLKNCVRSRVLPFELAEWEKELEHISLSEYMNNPQQKDRMKYWFEEEVVFETE